MRCNMRCHCCTYIPRCCYVIAILTAIAIDDRSSTVGVSNLRSENLQFYAVECKGTEVKKNKMTGQEKRKKEQQTSRTIGGKGYETGREMDRERQEKEKGRKEHRRKMRLLIERAREKKVRSEYISRSEAFKSHSTIPLSPLLRLQSALPSRRD